MIRTLGIMLTATGLLAAGMARAQEPPERPFGEGWRRIVPIPMPELGEGDRYVVWVEGGWLQVRRETSKGVTDWHFVLARAAGPKPPEVSVTEGKPRFQVISGDGRYFVREDANLLRCLRERKPAAGGAWPAVRFPDGRRKPAGSAGSGDQPPMLRGWLGDEGFTVGSSAGPSEDRLDGLVRLSPPAKVNGYGYESMDGPLRRAFFGENWLFDDGDLLVAQRTLEAGVLADVEIGDPAPPLAAKTFDGKALKLEDYRGKFVLLDFWATWCSPCLAEIPHLKEIHEAYGKEGRLAIIGLSLDGEVEAPRKLVAERDIPWVQVHIGETSGSPVARAFGVRSIPATFLIGPDGNVVAKGMRGEQIKEVVAKALARK